MAEDTNVGVGAGEKIDVDAVQGPDLVPGESAAPSINFTDEAKKFADEQAEANGDYVAGPHVESTVAIAVEAKSQKEAVEKVEKALGKNAVVTGISELIDYLKGDYLVHAVITDAKRDIAEVKAKLSEEIAKGEAWLVNELGHKNVPASNDGDK